MATRHFRPCIFIPVPQCHLHPPWSTAANQTGLFPEWPDVPPGWGVGIRVSSVGLLMWQPTGCEGHGPHIAQRSLRGRRYVVEDRNKGCC